MPRDTLVIAGATGFIGHAVAERLAHRAEAPLDVVGLTRGRREATGAWHRLVTCDLFSLKDVEAALAGARYAAYLVHSMLPSARLVQGSFADLDLICADNFARAARKAGVEQIVYLGGLMPEGEVASPHLASRREVEAALGAHGAAVTTLRAGLVIGPGGSSFEILTRLVRRLPAMVLPKWSERACQPIDLGTVAALVDHVVGRTSTYGETYDIGGPEVLRYRDMIQIVGEELGTPAPRRRRPAADAQAVAAVGLADHRCAARAGGAADREPAPRHGVPRSAAPGCRRAPRPAVPRLGGRLARHRCRARPR